MRASRFEEGQASTAARTAPTEEGRGEQQSSTTNTTWRPKEQRDANTYLFDNGLRECLAHGDAVSKCNSAAGAATSGGGGVVLSGELGRRRAGSRATRDENFSAAVLTD
jgi:hypothetical protein